MSSPDCIPVISGIGEVTDRPKDITASLEPIDLMAEAARRADTHGLLARVDSIDIVGLVSWRYYDTPALLNERLGIAPKRSVYGLVGGESPVRYLHEAARRIALGTSEIGLVVGGEAQYAVGHAKRAGIDLPWTPYAVNAPKFQRAADHVHPLAKALGVSMPINIYPFYDAATAHAWGQTPREAQRESGELWSLYSEAAARNPYSWLPKALAPEEITTVTRDNRVIAWPYTKRQVANPNVNQGAAMILTSLAHARAALRAMSSANERSVWGTQGRD
jgi:acetyl-CoA C-acetyltransferase